MKKSKFLWNNETIQKLIDLYPKLSARQIVDFIPYSSISIIQSRIRKLGLKKDINIGNKKYSFNSKFFELPNILNSYWAGFIGADGCITRKSNILSISVQEKDICLLENFVNDLNYNGKIYSKIDHGKYPQSQISICGIKDNIAVDLFNNFNITSNKTLTLEPPKNLSYDNSLAYISGNLDGDGSIYFRKENNRNLPDFTVSFCGTLKMMNWIKEILSYSLPKSINKKIYQRNNINILNYSGFDAEIILNELNKIDIVKLDRKWSKLEEWRKYVATR